MFEIFTVSQCDKITVLQCDSMTKLLCGSVLVWQFDSLKLWRYDGVTVWERKKVWHCESVPVCDFTVWNFDSIPVWQCDFGTVFKLYSLKCWQYDSLIQWPYDFFSPIYMILSPLAMDCLLSSDWSMLDRLGRFFFYTGNSICWAHKAAKQVAKKRNHVLVRGGVSQNVWNMSQPLIGGFSQNKVAVCYF